MVLSFLLTLSGAIGALAQPYLLGAGALGAPQIPHLMLGNLTGYIPVVQVVESSDGTKATVTVIRNQNDNRSNPVYLIQGDSSEVSNLSGASVTLSGSSASFTANLIVSNLHSGTVIPFRAVDGADSTVFADKGLIYVVAVGNPGPNLIHTFVPVIKSLTPSVQSQGFGVSVVVQLVPDPKGDPLPLKVSIDNSSQLFMFCPDSFDFNEQNVSQSHEFDLTLSNKAPAGLQGVRAIELGGQMLKSAPSELFVNPFYHSGTMN